MSPTTPGTGDTHIVVDTGQRQNREPPMLIDTHVVLVCDDSQGCSILFPNLPGCAVVADSYEQAVSLAVGAPRQWLAIQDNKQWPQALSAEALAREPWIAQRLAQGSWLGSMRHHVATATTPLF